jgi:crotonobetainyl-CoA:carnitine CoA-transferase CaiB-like acyl-CoA transferase
VIKVEAAAEGDVLRGSSPVPGGISRTSRSSTAGSAAWRSDLKTPAGAEVARRLVRACRRRDRRTSVQA